MGGELEIRAVFPDSAVRIRQFQTPVEQEANPGRIPS